MTGANGFLGSSLVRALLERTGYQVRCLVRPGCNLGKLDVLIGNHPGRIELSYGALNNYQTCLEAVKNIAIVFHLASAKSGAPAEMFHGSSVATKCLLEAVRNLAPTAKLVHCSSFSVYGVADLKKGETVDENTPLERHPEKRDTYAFSKWHQERLVREYCQKHGIPTVIMRPGVIYGPGGTPISTRVGLNLFGLFLFIGGRNMLPLTYLDNCADAFVTAALNSQFSGEGYNVVDDDPITAKEYLRLYRRDVKKVRSIPIPYFVMWLISIACEKYYARSKGQLPDIFTRYKTASMWKPQRFSNKKLKDLGWTMNTPTETGLNINFQSLKES